MIIPSKDNWLLTLQMANNLQGLFMDSKNRGDFYRIAGFLLKFPGIFSSLSV